MTDKKTTRKGNTPIYVWVTPDEKAAIEANARQTGHSTSAYLRSLGLGFAPKSIVDNEQVIELARINGDIGRLGGLLKLWLTNDARTAQFGENVIRTALTRIEDSRLPVKRRHTAQRLFECLQVEGYVGGYCIVHRYVKAWKLDHSASPPVTQVFVPLYLST